MDHYELFQEYLRIDHQIDEFYHTLAQRQGLSDSALWVLWSLVELGEGSTQTDICRQIFQTKQTVHSSVRKLEKDGVLALRPGEGREIALYFTDRGRELVREKILPVMEAERTAAQGLEAEEWRTVIRLSRKWFSLFREAAASGPEP
ncbi:MAG: MarR family transcriptional regulator [Oscillibacter sp.]|nr:MarR family transcriptional regulator [Oscillibacter sp.]